jgi:glycosyltransferase involved in cell wall biosynthesis
MVWPEPKSSAAGTRMLQLIELFQKQYYEVIFASAAQQSDFSFDLKSINVVSEKIHLNDDGFDVFVKNLKPEIVLFDRYITEEQFGWRVHENSPTSIRILETVDLHCLRLERQNSVKKNEDFHTANLLQSDFAKREIASILRCDLSIMISSFEIEILKFIFKIDENSLYYLPLFYEIKKPENLKNIDQRNDFVFIGNFLHEPNFDAVKILKEKLWPKIRIELPDAKMNIFGAYPSQKILQLHNEKERFLINGRADNASETIENARILLAPLRFGAGLKGKLLEAMQSGTPSITTTIGSEGISGHDFWNGFIENDFDVFAQKAIVLFKDEILWKNCQKIGFEILSKQFNKEKFEDLFHEKLNFLTKNIEHIRKNNFFGSMLMHHTLQSTKYMSRWIQEKNK